MPTPAPIQLLKNPNQNEEKVTIRQKDLPGWLATHATFLIVTFKEIDPSKNFSPEKLFHSNPGLLELILNNTGLLDKTHPKNNEKIMPLKLYAHQTLIIAYALNLLEAPSPKETTCPLRPTGEETHLLGYKAKKVIQLLKRFIKDPGEVCISERHVPDQNRVWDLVYPILEVLTPLSNTTLARSPETEEKYIALSIALYIIVRIACIPQTDKGLSSTKELPHWHLKFVEILHPIFDAHKTIPEQKSMQGQFWQSQAINLLLLPPQENCVTNTQFAKFCDLDMSPSSTPEKINKLIKLIDASDFQKSPYSKEEITDWKTQLINTAWLTFPQVDVPYQLDDRLCSIEKWQTQIQYAIDFLEIKTKYKNMSPLRLPLLKALFKIIFNKTFLPPTYKRTFQELSLLNDESLARIGIDIAELDLLSKISSLTVSAIKDEGNIEEPHEFLRKSEYKNHISSIQKDTNELTLQFSNFRSLTATMKLLELYDNTNYSQDLKLTPSRQEQSSTAVEHQDHEFFIQSLQELAEEHILHNSIIKAIPEEKWNELYQTLQDIAAEPMERQPGKIDEVFTHFREEEKAADEEKRDSVDIEISTKHIIQMPLVLADFLKLYQGLLHWLERTSYKARRTSEVIHTKLYDKGFNLRKLSEQKVLKCRLLSCSIAYPSPVRHISRETMIANQSGVKDATDIFFANTAFLAGEYEEKLIHEKEIKLADHANIPILSLDQYRKFIKVRTWLEEDFSSKRESTPVVVTPVKSTAQHEATPEQSIIIENTHNSTIAIRSFFKVKSNGKAIGLSQSGLFSQTSKESTAETLIQDILLEQQQLIHETITRQQGNRDLLSQLYNEHTHNLCFGRCNLSFYRLVANNTAEYTKNLALETTTEKTVALGLLLKELFNIQCKNDEEAFALIQIYCSLASPKLIDNIGTITAQRELDYQHKKRPGFAPKQHSLQKLASYFNNVITKFTSILGNHLAEEKTITLDCGTPGEPTYNEELLHLRIAKHNITITDADLALITVMYKKLNTIAMNLKVWYPNIDYQKNFKGLCENIRLLFEKTIHPRELTTVGTSDNRITENGQERTEIRYESISEIEELPYIGIVTGYHQREINYTTNAPIHIAFLAMALPATHAAKYLTKMQKESADIRKDLRMAQSIAELDDYDSPQPTF